MTTINPATLDERIRQLEREIESLRKQDRIRQLEAELERLKFPQPRVIPMTPSGPTWPNAPWRYDPGPTSYTTGRSDL